MLLCKNVKQLQIYKLYVLFYNERIMETRATHDVRYDNINSTNMGKGCM